MKYQKALGDPATKSGEVPQYTQVGNAVPPLMAKVIGKHIFNILK